MQDCERQRLFMIRYAKSRSLATERGCICAKSPRPYITKNFSETLLTCFLLETSSILKQVNRIKNHYDPCNSLVKILVVSIGNNRVANLRCTDLRASYLNYSIAFRYSAARFKRQNISKFVFFVSLADRCTFSGLHHQTRVSEIFGMKSS